MDKKYILIILLFLFSVCYKSPAQTYFGAGVDYIYPLGKLNEVNKPAFGYNIQLESRNFCKLWYGLRLDYFSPNKVDSMNTSYYKNFILISPQVRYNFVNCNSYQRKLIPYIQALFTISSITGLDDAQKLGLGGAAGGGLSYGFSIGKTCFLLDLNVLYNADNFIYRVESRPSLESITGSINLSVRI
ncbi:MAG: hypothetical protein WCR42_06810 [bacterium]